MELNKRGTSFRLSDRAIKLLDELASKLGISKTSVVEMAIRRVWDAEFVTAKARKQ